MGRSAATQKYPPSEKYCTRLCNFDLIWWEGHKQAIAFVTRQVYERHGMYSKMTLKTYDYDPNPQSLVAAA